MPGLGVKYNNVILNKVATIARLEQKVSNITIDRKWLSQLRDNYIISSSISSYYLEGGKQRLESEQEISQLPQKHSQFQILNEIEVRKSFSLYFKEEELNLETFHYLHRYLDNLYDEKSNLRGKFRKSQEIEDALLYDFDYDFPRYGFVTRIISEFVQNLNEPNLNEYIAAAMVQLKFFQIAPYNRANLRLARILSEGIMYISGIKKNWSLDLNSIFAVNRYKYYEALNFGLQGKESIWVEYFLDSMIQALYALAKDIEKISGGSLRPLSNQVVRLTKRQKTIVELLKKNEQMSGSEIANILGVSRQNIFVIMQKLMQRNIVDKIGQGSTSRYKLKI